MFPATCFHPHLIARIHTWFVLRLTYKTCLTSPPPRFAWLAADFLSQELQPRSEALIMFAETQLRWNPLNWLSGQLKHLPALLQNQAPSWPWQQPQNKQGVKRDLGHWGRNERTVDSESMEVQNSTRFLQWGFTVNMVLLLARTAISTLKTSFFFGVRCAYCLLQALT